MSSIVHKVKDAITPSHKSSAPEGSHGPHSSRVANAADPRIDSDRDGRAAHTTTTGAHDYSSSDNYTYGSNTTGTHGSGVPEGVAGPHKTRVANAADPRIDSDLDRSRNMGANPSGTSTTGTHTTGVTGTSGLNNHSTTHGTAPVHNSNVANKLDPRVPSTTTGTTTGTGTYNSSLPEGSTGPHNSRIANAADPRVDSDADRSRNMGMNPSGTSTTGTGFTGNTHTTGTSGLNNHSTTHGTAPVHNSNVANKLDPRVNASNTATTGTTGSTGMTGAHGTTTGTGLTGSHGTHNSSLPEGTTGPHSSRVANAADPRVDSDADRSRNMGMNRTTGVTGTHGATGFNNTSGPGPAPSTAGPHKSDALNKADPRVDSDLDGSKTIGGDKTYSRPADSSAMAYKDPTDAAQVPPSVLQKHVGPPTAANNGHTRQEGHHGL